MLNGMQLQHLSRDEPVDTTDVMTYCKQCMFEEGEQKWHAQLWDDHNQENGNKLRTYRLCKEELCAENYVRLNIPRLEKQTKLRCGVLPLHIELGRRCRPKKPLEERVCTLCNSGKIEDEIHFLTECDLNVDIRNDLYDAALASMPNIAQISHIDQYKSLMNDLSLSSCFCKLTYKMFE